MITFGLTYQCKDRNYEIQMEVELDDKMHVIFIAGCALCRVLATGRKHHSVVYLRSLAACIWTLAKSRCILGGCS